MTSGDLQNTISTPKTEIRGGTRLDWKEGKAYPASLVAFVVL